MKIEELINNRQLSQRLMRKIFVIILFTVALIFAMFNLDRLRDMSLSALGIAAPFLTGIAVAFVLNVLVRLYEEKVFAKLIRKPGRIWLKAQRGVSILLAFVTVCVIITCIILYVIPELVSSLQMFTDRAPGYIMDFSRRATELLEEMGITQEQLRAIQIDWNAVLSQISQYTGDVMSSLLSVFMDFTSGIITGILSLIFSVYMLAGKEKLLRNLKRVLFAYQPEERAEKIVEIASLSNRIFTGFVTGQLLEAIILGVLCYIGMSIFGFSYPPLISTLVGLTAIIPILGAYLGAGIGGFLLLLIDPMQCLWFLLFIVILQQIEGNVIYPRVVGTSIGLPGLWVLLAVVVCSDLFGVVGILLGVPAASVLYTLLRVNTTHRLRQKRIPESRFDPPAKTGGEK